MKSLLIIDIEATCWNRDEHTYIMADMEIIEIGAVLVRQKKIVEEYQTYIRPAPQPAALRVLYSANRHHPGTGQGCSPLPGCHGRFPGMVVRPPSLDACLGILGKL